MYYFPEDSHLFRYSNEKYLYFAKRPHVVLSELFRFKNEIYASFSKQKLYYFQRIVISFVTVRHFNQVCMEDLKD